MSIDSPSGFWAQGVSSGLKNNALDLALIRNLGPNFDFAGVVTANQVKAAPVLWTQQIINSGKAKAVILNSGGANACTGSAGFLVVHQTVEYLAKLFELAPIDIAVCSTGIIGEQLNIDLIKSGIDQLAERKGESSGVNAAEAIITTDTMPKSSSLENFGFRLSGIAKGAGMISPAMATMLCVLTTDAQVSHLDIQQLLSTVVQETFNRISADGSMSTNDTVLLMSSGASNVSPIKEEFVAALREVCNDLAMQILRDAEGATLIARITVKGAKSIDDALRVARKIADDSLVKTALFGRDPNWGRVAAAAGSAGVEFDQNRLDIFFNQNPVCLNGTAYGDRTSIELEGDFVDIAVDLKLGDYSADVHTTDLSIKYVEENSAYSS